MNRPRFQIVQRFLILMIVLVASRRAPAQPKPEATAAFNSYVTTVESRLIQQHQSPLNFLAGTRNDQSLHQSDLIIENLTPPTAELPGALLHHWRGTAFAPHATAADFDRVLRDFNAYPKLFAPQVLQAKVLTQRPDFLQASMRVRQHHVLTVVMDTTYDVTFAQLNPQDRYSTSRSTRIYEIDTHGHPLPDSEAHGFLWRLNTYWSYEERDGGLYIQIESISLSRSIPTGLGWAIRPFVESIPRESLEFTLRSATNAIRK